MLIISLASIPMANASSIHSGRIYLQVESHGEAWYVNPADDTRYYLGRPDDAFGIMRDLGLGISTVNLSKIPVGILQETFGADDDNDRLSNDLEIALGTDPLNPDTDYDDYSDFEELQNGFNPLGAGPITTDQSLVSKVKGKILLQVEDNGEAWYVNPADAKRYFLGRPADAFAIMRLLGIGISNDNLAKIPGKYTAQEQDVLNNYAQIAFPTGWQIQQQIEGKDEYRDMPIIDDIRLVDPDGKAHIKIFLLDPPKNSTLVDLNIRIRKATEISEKDFLAVLKPGLKQVMQFNYADYKYTEIIYDGDKKIKKEIILDHGQYMLADIMKNSKSFLHLEMLIYDQADIPLYEQIFDQMINSISIYE